MSGKFGPNVTKLITRFITREAVLPGGGIADGLKFFADPDYRHKVMAKAGADVEAVIALVKAAPDNPYGNDDEVIAAILLEEIRKKQEGGRP